MIGIIIPKTKRKMKKKIKTNLTNPTNLSDFTSEILLNQVNKPLNLSEGISIFPSNPSLPSNYMVCMGNVCCMSDYVTNSNGSITVHVVCWSGDEIKVDKYFIYN